MVPRNREALAATPLPEDETLTRKAVQLALGGHPPLRWPCIELILPPCHERTVIFVLPLIESAEDVCAAMNTTTLAFARGTLRPGEGERVALVVETFAQTIDATGRRIFAVNRLHILGLIDFGTIYGCKEMS